MKGNLPMQPCIHYGYNEEKHLHWCKRLNCSAYPGCPLNHGCVYYEAAPSPVFLRQMELAAWASKNFDGANQLNTIENTLAMVEEIGELAYLLIKRKQHIRGVNDDQHTKNSIADAFADAVIFGIQAMSCEGIDAAKAINETITEILERDWKENPYNGKVRRNYGKQEDARTEESS